MERVKRLWGTRWGRFVALYLVSLAMFATSAAIVRLLVGFLF
jgi:hypothetical protein